VCAEEKLELLSSYGELVGGRRERVLTPVSEDILARLKGRVFYARKLRD